MPLTKKELTESQLLTYTNKTDNLSEMNIGTTSYSWFKAFASVLQIRQVSRLIVHRFHPLPSFPVIYGYGSLITVTSSYRTCTCFPFHRSQSNTRLLRHLITTYSIPLNISYFYKLFNSFFKNST